MPPAPVATPVEPSMYKHSTEVAAFSVASDATTCLYRECILRVATPFKDFQCAPEHSLPLPPGQ
jgi:hypothetical protein